jgi:heme A synthase
MKKVFKWIIGILIGLVVIAVVLGAGFMVARRFAGINWMRENRLAQRGDFDQGTPQQNIPRQNMPGQNMQRNFGRNGMPMYYYGGMGFRPFGGLMLVGRLVGGVFKLVILGLVIFLAVTLALRPRQAKQTAATSTAGAAPEATQAVMLNCPHCAREIQADWKHCPYCGNSLEATEPDLPVA